MFTEEAWEASHVPSQRALHQLVGLWVFLSCWVSPGAGAAAWGPPRLLARPPPPPSIPDAGRPCAWRGSRRLGRMNFGNRKLVSTDTRQITEPPGTPVSSSAGQEGEQKPRVAEGTGTGCGKAPGGGEDSASGACWNPRPQPAPAHPGCVLLAVHTERGPPAFKTHISSTPSSAWGGWVLVAAPAARGAGPAQRGARDSLTDDLGLQPAQPPCPSPRLVAWATALAGLPPHLHVHVLVACCMPGWRCVGAAQPRWDLGLGRAQGCVRRAAVGPGEDPRTGPPGLRLRPHLETETSQVWHR